ncbi:unnamed protein product [Rotaria sordida]|uniref:UBC core domain-containing protein n=1 Tax=Rotaria sordida TaxID=392033 RepID=A0A814ZWD0_9BILA|nr:unnamed protein product [Rotaria sordida]CAF4103228.1 unnamed protein product [Rotaria sordida]
MISPAKNTDDVFIAYDPFDANKEKFKKDEVAPDDVLSKYSYISLRDNVLDVRPIEQLTVILFDISSSMQHTQTSNSKSLLDLSISALGAWCDKFYSYRLPHAIGLIYCGAKITSTTQLIHEACPITNNFSDFENSLRSRQDCGSSTSFDDGLICHEILRSHWTHQTIIYDVLKQIIGLLSEPEPNDAISTAKGNLYNTAREDYYKELKEYNEKYAKATIEELKKQYQLEQYDI